MKCEACGHIDEEYQFIHFMHIEIEAFNYKVLRYGRSPVCDRIDEGVLVNLVACPKCGTVKISIPQGA